MAAWAGGGGGGGGALAYQTTIAVTPGEILSVTVGSGGAGGSYYGSGGAGKAYGGAGGNMAGSPDGGGAGGAGNPRAFIASNHTDLHARLCGAFT